MNLTNLTGIITYLKRPNKELCCITAMYDWMNVNESYFQ